MQCGNFPRLHQRVGLEHCRGAGARAMRRHAPKATIQCIAFYFYLFFCAAARWACPLVLSVVEERGHVHRLDLPRLRQRIGLERRRGAGARATRRRAPTARMQCVMFNFYLFFAPPRQGGRVPRARASSGSGGTCNVVTCPDGDDAMHCVFFFFAQLQQGVRITWA
jgi:hypothetical protein